MVLTNNQNSSWDLRQCHFLLRIIILFTYSELRIVLVQTQNLVCVFVPGLRQLHFTCDNRVTTPAVILSSAITGSRAGSCRPFCIFLSQSFCRIPPQKCNMHIQLFEYTMCFSHMTNTQPVLHNKTKHEHSKLIHALHVCKTVGWFGRTSTNEIGASFILTRFSAHTALN